MVQLKKKKIKMTLKISKPLDTHEKLTRHISLPLKVYHFGIEQFFIDNYLKVI